MEEPLQEEWVKSVNKHRHDEAVPHPLFVEHNLPGLNLEEGDAVESVQKICVVVAVVVVVVLWWWR